MTTPSTLEVRSPADGSVVGSVAVTDPDEIEAIVGRVRGAQRSWAAASPRDRADVLARLRRVLAADAPRIVATIQAETGKTWEDAAIAEVGYCLEALRHWAGRGPRMLADHRGRSWRAASVLGRRTVVRRAPYGVVGVIAPWNYPLAIVVADVAPALLAGNGVVLKPSEATPLSAELLAQSLRRAGLPDGVLAIANGGGATGAAVVDHVDMVMFTGSTVTGRRVAERAARRPIPASLELGGKDALVVCADADLDRAAHAAAYYGMQNAGQICMSIERVYVDASVHDAFLDRLAAVVGGLRQGTGAAGCAEVGAITTEAQLEVVERHVADALARGARLVAGGARNGRPGRFFEPTVLADADHSMLCMTQETFGPTLAVMPFWDEDEAVRLVNDSDYGLSASVFCGDPTRGERLARGFEVGSVVVNDALIFFGATHLPMGGWKNSGVGARHGTEGLLKYTRPQSIVVGRRRPRRDPQWFPYRPIVSRAIARALRLSAWR